MKPENLRYRTWPGFDSQELPDPWFEYQKAGTKTVGFIIPTSFARRHYELSPTWTLHVHVTLQM